MKKQKNQKNILSSIPITKSELEEPLNIFGNENENINKNENHSKEEKQEIPNDPANFREEDKNDFRPLNFVSIFLKSKQFATNHQKNRKTIKRNLEEDQKNMHTTQLLLQLQEPSQRTSLIKKYSEIIQEKKKKENKSKSNLKLKLKSQISQVHTSKIIETHPKGIREIVPNEAISIIEEVPEPNEEEKFILKNDSNVEEEEKEKEKEKEKGDFMILDPTIELKSKDSEDINIKEIKEKKLEDYEAKKEKTHRMQVYDDDEEEKELEEDGLETMEQGTNEEDENVSEKLYFETMNKFEFIFICISIPLVMLAVMNYVVQEDPTSLTYGQDYKSSIYKLFMMTSFGKLPTKYYRYEVLCHTIYSIFICLFLYQVTKDLKGSLIFNRCLAQKCSILIANDSEQKFLLEKRSNSSLNDTSKKSFIEILKSEIEIFLEEERRTNEDIGNEEHPLTDEDRLSAYKLPITNVWHFVVDSQNIKGKLEEKGNLINNLLFALFAHKHTGSDKDLNLNEYDKSERDNCPTCKLRNKLKRIFFFSLDFPRRSYFSDTNNIINESGISHKIRSNIQVIEQDESIDFEQAKHSARIIDPNEKFEDHFSKIDKVIFAHQGIIITFSSPVFKKKFLEKYHQASLNSRSDLSLLKQNEINIFEPPPPEDLIWENIAAKKQFYRKPIITFLICFCIIAFSVVVNFYLEKFEESQHNFLAMLSSSLMISIVNEIIERGVEILNATELHKSFSGQDSSLVIKISILLFFHTILVAILIDVNSFLDFFKDDGLFGVMLFYFIYTIFFYPFTNSILSFSWSIYIYRRVLMYFWNRCFLTEEDKNVNIMNQSEKINVSESIFRFFLMFYPRPEFDYYFRYAYRIFLLWLTIFLVPLYPLVVVLPLIAVTIEYLFDYILIHFRICRPPKSVSPILNHYFLLLIRLTYFVYLGACIYYFLKINITFFIYVHIIFLAIATSFFTYGLVEESKNQEFDSFFGEFKRCGCNWLDKLLNFLIPYDSTKEVVEMATTLFAHRIIDTETYQDDEHFRKSFQNSVKRNNYAIRIPAKVREKYSEDTEDTESDKINTHQKMRSAIPTYRRNLIYKSEQKILRRMLNASTLISLN